MLFWIFLIVTIVAIVLYGVARWGYHYCYQKITDNYSRSYRHKKELFGILSEVTNWIWAIGAVFSIAMIIIMGCCHMGTAAQQAQIEARYQNLQYNIDTIQKSENILSDEWQLRHLDVIKEIEEWNKEIVYWKIVAEDKWIGIFVPNIYDNVERIELP